MPVPVGATRVRARTAGSSSAHRSLPGRVPSSAQATGWAERMKPEATRPSAASSSASRGVSSTVPISTPMIGHAPSGAPLFVGRQGIFTAGGAVHGYEFLYRSGGHRQDEVDHWPASAQDGATLRVLEATFGPGGVRTVAADALVFINFTRSFLVNDLPVPAAPERLVLEVVESVTVDATVLAGLRALIGLGFRIAVDDFVATPDQYALLPYATYVKLDMRDVARREDLVDIARSCGAMLVAEHIETPADLDHCHRLGIGLFQGNFLEQARLFDRSMLDTVGGDGDVPSQGRPASVAAR